LHCGLRAHTISSTVGSSADAGATLSAKVAPQSNKEAYFTARCDSRAAGVAAAEVSLIFLNIVILLA
jgi:hypothetical protein